MPTRITYKTTSTLNGRPFDHGRAFDRFFKEQSLDEMKRTVCSKLGLDLTTAPFKLFHVRTDENGCTTTVDLEDDDDFEVFKSHAVYSTRVDVRVLLFQPGPVVSPPL